MDKFKIVKETATIWQVESEHDTYQIAKDDGFIYNLNGAKVKTPQAIYDLRDSLIFNNK
jgi:hypothetical protein